MSNYTTITSDKSKNTALILCLLGFLGVGGLHDFYVGRYFLGFVKLCTANFLMVGSIIDTIKIASGSYLDNAKAPLRK